MGVGFDSFVAIDGSGLKQGGNICEGVAKLYKRYIKQKIVSYTTFTFLPEQQIQDHNAENGLRY